MKLLITGASSLLGKTLTGNLIHDHHLRLLDSVPIETSAQFIQGDIRDQQTCYRACQGMEALVHLCELPEPEGSKEHWEQDALDFASRGTYNLLKAAVEEGITRGVFLGTTRMFQKYPPGFTVSETWRPRPDPEDVFQIAKYLGESTAHQYARVEDISLISLRVGHVVLEEECQGKPFDPLWVDARDVVNVIVRALNISMRQDWRRYHWRVAHVVPDNPGSFGICKNPLGVEPEHNFEAWRDAS